MDIGDPTTLATNECFRPAAPLGHHRSMVSLRRGRESAVAVDPGSTLRSVALLGWGALLTWIFLLHRAADVGRVGDLIAATRPFGLAVDPVRAGEAAAGAAVAVAVVAAWSGVGWSLDHVLRTLSTASPPAAEPAALRWARRCALGAGVTSLAWFVLGLVGQLTAGPALAMLALGWVLALAMSRRGGPAAAPPRDEPWDALGIAAAVVVAIPILLAAIAALAPPTGKDALIYHLALPKGYLAAGRFAADPENMPAYFAQGAEMHGLWAMALGRLLGERVGEAAFGAIAFASYPLLLGAVYGWARSLAMDRPRALTAAALVAAVPTAYMEAGSGYVELALTLHVVLAVQAAARWWTTGSRLALAYLAVFLGGALAIKLLAVFVLLPLGLVVLLRARKVDSDPAARPGAELLGGAAALAAAVMLAAPWYVRTWVRTGSPLFPFHLALWPAEAPGWDTQRSELFGAFLAGYGPPDPGLLDYVLAPLRLSLTAQPELAAYHDGVLGVSFLFGLPLLLGALRGRLGPELRLAAGLAGVFVVFWLATSQQLRFLLPALALLAVATAAAAATRLATGALLATTAAGLLVIGAWFLQQSPLPVVVGGEAREAYLARRLDYYPYYHLVNTSLPADARVWLVDMRRDTYHLERPYFSDYFAESYTLRRLVEEAADLEDLRRRVRAMGVSHILARHDDLLHPQRSVILEDDRRAMLGAFLFDRARVIRADPRFVLTRVEASAGGS